MKRLYFILQMLIVSVIVGANTLEEYDYTFRPRIFVSDYNYNGSFFDFTCFPEEGIAVLENRLGGNEYYGVVEIPKSINANGKTYDVVGIDDQAFRDEKDILSISIPKSVQYIGRLAFYGCTGLTEITLPESLDSVGGGAFWNCTSLTKVEIPNGVLTIGEGMFYGCTSLDSIIIPNSVERIRESAFQGCSKLSYIQLPSKIKEIKASTFEDCISLSSIVIPNGVTEIGLQAFMDCISLDTVVIPSTVTLIGSGAFAGCDTISEILCYSEEPPYCVESAFAGNDNNYCTLRVPAASLLKYAKSEIWGSFFKYLLVGRYYYKFNADEMSAEIRGIKKNFGGNLTIPSQTTYQALDESMPIKVTGIDSYAFAVCEQITSITFPDGITHIGQYAFAQCNGLISLSLPEGLTEIEEGAFFECDKLKSLSIPEGVTKLGRGAFMNDSNIISLSLPSTLELLEDGVFFNCSSLREVNCSAECPPECYFNVFYGVDQMNCNLIVPANSFEKYAKADEWGDLLTYVRAGGFYCKLNVYKWTADIRGLNDNYYGELVVPSQVKYNELDFNVTGIESYGFAQCYKLTSVTLPDGLEEIGEGAFYGCVNLSSLSIPEGVIKLGIGAFMNCSSLLRLSLPSTLRQIGMGAFYNCSSLEWIYCIAYYPPECGSNVFYNVDKINCNLSVQVNRFEEYAEAKTWGEFLEYVIVDGLYYKLNVKKKTANIGCVNNNYSGNLIVPSQIKYNELNFNVTGIDSYGFAQCYELTSVTLSDGIEEIGEGAFYGCNIDSIFIPQGVTRIGRGAFMETRLGILALPSSIQCIEDVAFFNCSNLEIITCEAVTPPLCGKNVFYGLNKEECVLKVPYSSIDNYLTDEVWGDFKIEEIDYHDLDGIIQNKLLDINIENIDGVIIITGLNRNDKTRAYGIDGKFLGEGVENNGSVIIKLPNLIGSKIILKIGNKITKIQM